MTKIRSTDASGIDDRRGSGGGGGGLGGLGSVLGGGGMKVGGGLIGILVLVAALVLPRLLGGGGMASLHTDNLAKAYAQVLLTMDVPSPD